VKPGHVGGGARSSVVSEPWATLEVICIVWFSSEYVVRFLSSPCKKKFLMSFLNFIDIVAIVPFFVSLALLTHSVNSLSAIRIIRLIRIVRVFRVLKLSRHSDALRILGATLRASVREILMVAFFIVLALVLFSSGIYYAEYGTNPMFSSIPDTFWFCLTSMKTIGYGDKVPVTVAGKLMGVLCTVSGVLTITLPMPVIMTNFKHFYNTMQNNNKAENEHSGSDDNVHVPVVF